MYTQKEMLEIALQQSAVDLSCKAEDLTGSKNAVFLSVPDPRARKYLTLPHICSIVSYGQNAVASVREESMIAPVREYLDTHKTGYLFSTPDIYDLNRILSDGNARVCFTAEYFLSRGPVSEPASAYAMKWFYPADFASLYLPEWGNALCESRKELDVLGIGAFDGEKLIAFAACSADADIMRQIGVDVLPDYRGRGLSKALTARLSNRILEEGTVPFYCAEWSNLRSVKNALACGYYPAWAQMDAGSCENNM